MVMYWNPVYSGKKRKSLVYVEILLYSDKTEICNLYTDGNRTYHYYIKADEQFPWEAV